MRGAAATPDSASSRPAEVQPSGARGILPGHGRSSHERPLAAALPARPARVRAAAGRDLPAGRAWLRPPRRRRVRRGAPRRSWPTWSRVRRARASCRRRSTSSARRPPASSSGRTRPPTTSPSRSRAQADGRLQRAEREAEIVRRDADEYAEQVVVDTRLLWDERQRLIEDIRQLADEVLGTADDALERLKLPEPLAAAEQEAEPTTAEEPRRADPASAQPARRPRRPTRAVPYDLEEPATSEARIRTPPQAWPIDDADEPGPRGHRGVRRLGPVDDDAPEDEDSAAPSSSRRSPAATPTSSSRPSASATERRRGMTGPPRVKLGHQAPNGIAAGLLALVERGAARRPRIARELRGRVEIRFDEDYAPVRLDFGDDEVLVEDGNGKRWSSDLVIEGSLPDVVQLATAPLVGGAAEADRQARPGGAGERGGAPGADRGQPAARAPRDEAARGLERHLAAAAAAQRGALVGRLARRAERLREQPSDRARAPCRRRAGRLRACGPRRAAGAATAAARGTPGPAARCRRRR